MVVIRNKIYYSKSGLYVRRRPLKTVMRKHTRAVCNRREKVINKITRPGNRIFLFLPTNRRNFLVEIYIRTIYNMDNGRRGLRFICAFRAYTDFKGVTRICSRSNVWPRNSEISLKRILVYINFTNHIMVLLLKQYAHVPCKMNINYN